MELMGKCDMNDQYFDICRINPYESNVNPDESSRIRDAESLEMNLREFARFWEWIHNDLHRQS